VGCDVLGQLQPVCPVCERRHRPDLWCFSRHPTRVRRLLLIVLARDGDTCWLCGKPGANSPDHLLPQMMGGTHDPANLRAAHRWCNAARKATPLGAGLAEHSRVW
jgi:5-methylcytosine-specific restriction endonuclease McrA